MAVTYDTAQQPVSQAGAEITRITIDPLTPARVTLTLRHYDATGKTVPPKKDEVIIGSQEDVDNLDAEYTLAQLIALEPALQGLNTRLETALIAVGRLASGTVT